MPVTSPLPPENSGIIAPAPWQLNGKGYVVAVWMPYPNNTADKPEVDKSKAKPARNLFVTLAKKAGRLRPHGRVQLLIFAHYRQSDVGPYDELLHIPHLSHGIVAGYPSIDKIYVSTMASVINGQQNWGISKQLAEFDYQQDSAATQLQAESIQLKTLDQQAIAQIELQANRFTFPVSTALIPARLRTLVQDWGGKRFYTAPEASGQACLATIKNWWFDPFYFPDLSQGKVLAAFKMTHFKMTFPPATMTQANLAQPG
ncbi:hypothetical protein [Alkanindiges illinoisensis]|uniref:hypothetical protein n=1 Tax=Alkanindiges illinoisensis TaxID=197183 RepID=UPI0012EC7B57|nr:hypothetical protein [Alkanindiges illinoisensis]